MKNNIKKEENKKLYKNWKLYASALAIILIGAGTGLGIYYGINANHSEATKIDLSTLNLEKTMAVDENATQDETFQVFLDKNKNILNDNLTLDQVELSNFESPKITTNGKLTITVKEGIKSKFTGSIEIETKYILSNTNLSKVIRYLSDNNLLNFKIPTGTNSNLLLVVLINIFRQFMNENYQYASNIKSIELKTDNHAPSQEQLNTKGYIWSPPKNSTLPDGTKVSSLFIIVTVHYIDGTLEDIKITNLNATITMI